MTGHYMSQTALAFAARHPELVSHRVLLNGCASHTEFAAATNADAGSGRDSPFVRSLEWR